MKRLIHRFIFLALNFSVLHAEGPVAQRPVHRLDSLTRAIDSNLRALDLLAPHLDAEEQSFYAKDLSFIAAFPFQSYREVCVSDQGKFWINPVNDIIKNRLRNGIPWEKENQSLIRQYVKPGTVALDIGSHIGTHAVAMAECVGKDGLVLAFEPNAVIHRELSLNMGLNEAVQVIPLRCAVGKSKGWIEAVTPVSCNEGGTYVVEKEKGPQGSVMLPLDALGLNNISFIKIDVENMEADVLDGAVETIVRNRPVMLIEIQGNMERPVALGEDSEAMARISREKIAQLGYEITQVGSSRDYLAIPRTD